MSINVKKILLALLILSIGSAVAYFIKKHSPNKDDAKLYEVRHLYSTFPLPPNFEETGSSFQSKAELALVTKYFKSNNRYDDVKAFYIQRLTQSGWVLINERPMTDWFRDFGGRELEFRKDEYSVVIEYAGEKAKDQWDYGIALEWKKQL